MYIDVCCKIKGNISKNFMSINFTAYMKWTKSSRDTMVVLKYVQNSLTLPERWSLIPLPLSVGLTQCSVLTNRICGSEGI